MHYWIINISANTVWLNMVKSFSNLYKNIVNNKLSYYKILEPNLNKEQSYIYEILRVF